MNDIVLRLKQLAHAVAEQDWNEFSMRIPADPERDADLVIFAAAKEIASLRGELAAKQARIDELMQEYCPEEMTPDQLDTWARHQQLSPLSLEAREWIEAELAKEGGAA